MIRMLLCSSLLLAPPVFAQAAPPAGPPLNVNSGAFTGAGQLTDSSGRSIGKWSITATLKGGQFTGSGVAIINGTTAALPLNPRLSYFENGKCYFGLEQGRSHLSLGGPCTANGVSGRLNGFLSEGGVGSVTGLMSGTLKFGSAAASAPAAGVLPTAKLICAWMERIGGNFGGQDYHYELRYSNMASLTLNPGGTYRTANTSGNFVRQGNTIRLTSGQFAGAVGHLEPDKSGQPAVYFERDENRRPNGVHIVDPARTSCTVKRGG